MLAGNKSRQLNIEIFFSTLKGLNFLQFNLSFGCIIVIPYWSRQTISPSLKVSPFNLPQLQYFTMRPHTNLSYYLILLWRLSSSYAVRMAFPASGPSLGCFYHAGSHLKLALNSETLVDSYNTKLQANWAIGRYLTQLSQLQLIQYQRYYSSIQFNCSICPSVCRCLTVLSLWLTLSLPIKLY